MNGAELTVDLNPKYSCKLYVLQESNAIPFLWWTEWRSTGPVLHRSQGCSGKDQPPGLSLKCSGYLLGTSFHASASSGAAFLRVMLGQLSEKLRFSSASASARGSLSGTMASAGHSGSQTPQSMHSSGWITSMFSPS